MTVINANIPPMLDPPGNQTVNENQTLGFLLTAIDIDNDTLSFAMASDIPMPGAALNSNSGLFTWQPNFDQAGIYTLTFTVRTPVNDMTDSKTITITVNNVNR